MFYIDRNNTIKQKTQTNVTNLWEDGELNGLSLKVFDDPGSAVGMQACYYGNFYGDSDFSKFPSASGSNNTVQFDSQFGMHLWYPPENDTFIQYGWFEGQDTWTKQYTWPGMNGHAGVGCYSWGPGTTSYTMFVNDQNSVEFWWKDTNSSISSTDTHPINSFQNTTAYGIADVYPATSLGYTTFFYAQMADQTIRGYNISYNAENTTETRGDEVTVGGAGGPVKGLAGTHLSVTAISFKEDATDQTNAFLYVFYQEKGDDVSIFLRGLEGGQWSQSVMPIPDD